MARRSSQTDVAGDSNFVYALSRSSSGDLSDWDGRSEPESTVLDSEVIFGSCRRRLETINESEEESEIVFCTDNGRLSELPMNAAGFSSPEASKSKVKRFFCRSTKEFLEKASEIKSGDFLLFPTDGRVQKVADLQNAQKANFVIGFKSLAGEIVRFDVDAKMLQERKLYFVKSLDSESPSFASLLALLAFYVDNFLYFSIRFKQFVRFPVGQVIKRDDFMRAL